MGRISFILFSKTAVFAGMYVSWLVQKALDGALRSLLELLLHDLDAFNLAVGGHLAVELREILVHYARKFFLVDILSAGRIEIGMHKSPVSYTHLRAHETS